MNLCLREMAHALGGEVSGGQVLCPGPNHSRKDRSLAVRIGRSGEIICHSFAGDPWQECLDHVRRELGLHASKWAPTRPIPASKASLSPAPDNGARGRDLWQSAIDIRGTLAERYFVEERKLAIDGEDFSHVLRFHPRCRSKPIILRNTRPPLSH